MNLNSKQNLNKINQIILISQNYAAHKKMISNTKSSVDSFSPQRYIHNQKLLNQHSRYVYAVQRLKVQQVDQQNKRFSEKLMGISKPLSKEKVIQQNKQSITTRSFWNLQTSKQRQRSKKLKQISLENEKISQRISQSRSKQNFGSQSYYKQKSQTMRDLNVRGEYSERSQNVLENLVYNDLKINSNDIPFLPQLSKRYKIMNLKNSNTRKSSVTNEEQKSKQILQRNKFIFKKEMNFKL